MAKQQIKVDGETVALAAFRIVLKDGSMVTVSGPQTCDVRSGALLLLNRDAKGNETVSVVFGPGEWRRVN